MDVRITLNADLTFASSPLPALVDPKSPAGPPFDRRVEFLATSSGAGKWKLEERGGNQIVSFSYDNGIGNTMYVETLSKDPYIFYWKGDPDNGDRIAFSKLK